MQSQLVVIISELFHPFPWSDGWCGQHILTKGPAYSEKAELCLLQRNSAFLCSFKCIPNTGLNKPNNVYQHLVCMHICSNYHCNNSKETYHPCKNCEYQYVRLSKCTTKAGLVKWKDTKSCLSSM